MLVKIPEEELKRLRRVVYWAERLHDQKWFQHSTALTTVEFKLAVNNYRDETKFKE